jgi:8-oxo-dGTP diphosphatase
MNFHPTPPTPGFPARFHVAVDVVALTIRHNVLQVAVVRRPDDTSWVFDKDQKKVIETPRRPTDYALPGGHMNLESESLVEAARQTVMKKTGIEIVAEDLIQLGAYGNVGRDPRPGRTVSVAFVAFSPSFASPLPGSNAATAEFMDVVEVLSDPNRLEFDHPLIVRDAIKRVRQLMETTPIALKFCEDEFTMSELRHVYEVMFHPAYNPDADTLRYADRLRRDTEWKSLRDTERQIARISQAVAESSRELDLPLSDVPMRFNSVSSYTRNNDVVAKVHNLLEAEYRRSRRSTSRDEKSAREKLKLSFDAANFARKVEAIPGFVQRVEGKARPSAGGVGKPAQVYRKGKATQLDPPLTVPKKPTKAPKRPSRA